MTSMKSVDVYSDAYCSSTPVSLSMEENSSCVTANCSTTYYNGTDTYYYSTVACPSDAKTYAAEVFGSAQYLYVDSFTDSDCLTYQGTVVVLANGQCHAYGSTGTSVIVTIFPNGTTKWQAFKDMTCSYTSSNPYFISKELSDSHTCTESLRIYTDTSISASSDSSGSTVASSSGVTIDSNPETSSKTGSGLAVGGILGIAVGLLVLVIAIAGILLWRHRHSKTQDYLDAPTPLERAMESSQQAYATHVSPKSKTGSTILTNSDDPTASKLWNDEAIVAARIPREKVVTQHLINRGGFGEVYAGTYNGQRVAIKMLLPERKKHLTQVNAFLSEVKLMTTLDHPHIVTFIGVAWDSLTDLCVVTEYMAIDLKALLSKFHEQHVPTGFDHDKVKVALHVAHALTYLHSCAPPVIHRDLKSSNILLNEAMDAKVTDFGISRERVDATMTAGVGTSLWMAPEVMLGERYDDKADMFSFGVVLSELDSHTLPYAYAKNSSSGHRVTDAAILQLVSSGQLHAHFSGNGPPSMVELGLACVALDPNQRPTAAEALYKLQQILAKEV